MTLGRTFVWYGVNEMVLITLLGTQHILRSMNALCPIKSFSCYYKFWIRQVDLYSGRKIIVVDVFVVLYKYYND